MFESTNDETLRSFPQISIEFHDFVPGSTDGPFVRDTIQRLKRLGFTFVPYSYLMPQAHHADVLFLQPAKCGMGLMDRVNLGMAIALLNMQKFKSMLRGQWVDHSRTVENS
jgi:hypothetical protein